MKVEVYHSIPPCRNFKKSSININQRFVNVYGDQTVKVDTVMLVGGVLRYIMFDYIYIYIYDL